MSRSTPMHRRQVDDLDRAGCSIVEAAFGRVSRYQSGQIAALTLAFIFSTAACLALSYLNFVLNPECILFSKWVVSEPENGPFQVRSSSPSINYTTSFVSPTTSATGAWFYGAFSHKEILHLHSAETIWGKKRHCYVTQYGFASAAVGSFILCWFFVFFRPKREAYVLKKKTAASKLVVPAVIFCSAFAACALVAAITVQMGFVAWCHSVGATSNSCSSTRNYAISWANKTTYVDVFSVLVAAQVLSWIAEIIWICNLFLLASRMYYHVDFPSYFFQSLVVNHNHTLQSETESD